MKFGYLFSRILIDFSSRFRIISVSKKFDDLLYQSVTDFKTVDRHLLSNLRKIFNDDFLKRFIYLTKLRLLNVEQISDEGLRGLTNLIKLDFLGEFTSEKKFVTMTACLV
jgi:hypothetical protein